MAAPTGGPPLRVGDSGGGAANAGRAAVGTAIVGGLGSTGGRQRDTSGVAAAGSAAAAGRGAGRRA